LRVENGELLCDNGVVLSENRRFLCKNGVLLPENGMLLSKNRQFQDFFS